MSVWVLVSEELPPEEEYVEVCGSKRLLRALVLRRGEEWLIETSSDYINIYPPKYWRPCVALPENL